MWAVIAPRKPGWREVYVFLSHRLISGRKARGLLMRRTINNADQYRPMNEDELAARDDLLVRLQTY